MKKLSKYILIKHGEKEKAVETRDYITAKTKQLKEFGYNSLTEETVREELLKVFNKEDLSVIGSFIKDDIVIENQSQK